MFNLIADSWSVGIVTFNDSNRTVKDDILRLFRNVAKDLADAA